MYFSVQSVHQYGHQSLGPLWFNGFNPLHFPNCLSYQLHQLHFEHLSTIGIVPLISASKQKW